MPNQDPTPPKDQHMQRRYGDCSRYTFKLNKDGTTALAKITVIMTAANTDKQIRGSEVYENSDDFALSINKSYTVQ